MVRMENDSGGLQIENDNCMENDSCGLQQISRVVTTGWSSDGKRLSD